MIRPVHADAMRLSRPVVRAEAPLVAVMALLLIVTGPARAAQPPGLGGLDALYPSRSVKY